MTTTNVLQQEAPDCTLEVSKALAYVDHITAIITDMSRRDKTGGIKLSQQEVDAIGWMLSDAGIALHEIKTALYGEDKKPALKVV